MVTTLTFTKRQLRKRLVKQLIWQLLAEGHHVVVRTRRTK